MEIILLIIASIVMYYLYNGFQEYMRNPHKVDNSYNKNEYKIEDNPYIELSLEDKVKATEFGIIVRILKNVSSADGNICDLEKSLITNILDDIALEIDNMLTIKDIKTSRDILQTIFDNSNDDLDELAREFCDLTKGEYKKRLKLVEFVFALSYADTKLDDKEREKIIDIAAIFELNNDDFNKIYDEYETLYSNSIEMTKEKALEVLELKEEYSKEELDSKYKEKIKEHKQNIFLNKNLNKDFNQHSSKILREIDEAYKFLNEINK